MIEDSRQWRVSRSGYSIRTGWADEKKIIAKYPGSVPPEPGEFQAWLENAERICDLHNATLQPETTKEPECSNGCVSDGRECCYGTEKDTTNG